MNKLSKLISYLTLQEAFPIKKKGNGKPRDIPEEEDSAANINLKKAKEKAKKGSIGVPEEAKVGKHEPVNPFKGGSSIGRARADILDQYDRDEIVDPRERLALIDKLIDELLADWTTNEATAQHGELFKYGIQHGHDDRSDMLNRVKNIEDNKKQQLAMAMQNANQEDEELKNVPFKKGGSKK